MLFQFSFDGTESPEVRQAAAACILALGGGKPQAAVVQVSDVDKIVGVAPAITPAVTDAAAAGAKPRRTRKAAEPAQEPAATPAVAQQTVADAPAAVVTGTATKDDVRAAVNAVIESSPSGMTDAIGVLKKHGAAKMSDLSEDKYAAVIADCNAKIAEKASAGVA